MTTPLDIIVKMHDVTPPATLTFRYAAGVAAPADVDIPGEYSTGTDVVYVALMDSDGTPMPTMPLGTVLTFTTRTPFNSLTTIDRTVTSFSAGADHATIDLSGSPATNQGTLDFTAELPGSSTTKDFWAKRLDFTAANPAASVGTGLIGYTDSRYRVRPNPAWDTGVAFTDEKGDSRTVLSIAESLDRRFLELLARDIT